MRSSTYSKQKLDTYRPSIASKGAAPHPFENLKSRARKAHTGAYATKDGGQQTLRKSIPKMTPSSFMQDYKKLISGEGAQ